MVIPEDFPKLSEEERVQLYFEGNEEEREAMRAVYEQEVGKLALQTEDNSAE